MKIIIKNAKIIDDSSEFHQKTVDIKIVDGIIFEIGKIDNILDYQIIEKQNLHISQGWFDSSVCFCEPGFEDSENIANGLNVAARSGFVAVCVQPNTNPVIDNQAAIHFLKSKSAGFATNLYPIGAFTKNSAGTDMTELFDMQNAGAVAFGDYNKNIDNANLLKIGLQYTQDFGALLIAFSQNTAIKAKGFVNESSATLHLGMKTIPNLAEEIEIARNLFLLEYTGGKLHIPTISTENSVKLIKDAKANGLKVTCSASVHHLLLTDDLLSEFDTNYKIAPPLRTEKDRKSLIDGVLDNTIDMITTDHHPVDIEHKFLEFNLAKYGTIGLETAFPALNTVLPIENIVNKFTKSKNVFGIKSRSIAVGQKADLTMFVSDGDWVFEEKHIFSKSKNSALLGQKMKGHVVGIINNNQLVLN